ncbi:peptidoglycan editing factor PgeF [Candidatus Gracilibacteria bacterium]|nr:peptidoglycan editing factor PgeF [Candidatus Gracilibacteria bacterium]
MKIKSSLLNSKLLSKYSSIGHFISCKPFFLRSPQYDGEFRNQSAENLIALSQYYKIQGDNIVILNQTHSDAIIHITLNNFGQQHYADAAITNLSNILLITLASDCIPILLFDPIEKSIGVVHAGWKGLENGIIKKTITKMEQVFGTNPALLQIYIGPCISGINYEVGPEFIQKFSDIYPHSLSTNKLSGTYNLDIRHIALKQLVQINIQEKNVEVSKYCTYQDKENFNSYRRYTQTGDEYKGNNACGIMIK